MRSPDIHRVIVRLDDQETNRLNFTSPLTAKGLEDIRPSDGGFIDPRGEAKAVLDAIAQEAAGKIEV
ncbi:hypothetical protein [Calothrix sp. NIES-2098]|uniref:hypothetical protein n=1 Tax=Calothrix sp. NIES-2098 TaxID=1954171 RepID=UPI000B5EF183|nr:hypothetical protein NIES2098_47180 [Calothrix sp. NIES-2098]